jgi:hypothetical protein
MPENTMTAGNNACTAKEPMGNGMLWYGQFSLVLKDMDLAVAAWCMR